MGNKNKTKTVKNGVTTTTHTRKGGTQITTMKGSGYNLKNKVKSDGTSTIKGNIKTKNKNYKVKERGTRKVI